MFRHDVSNFQLSPRFLATLLEGGTGVGLLQRANEEVTRRAHQLWMETGGEREDGRSGQGGDQGLRPEAVIYWWQEATSNKGHRY